MRVLGWVVALTLVVASAACGPREKMPPRSIADSCDRVIEHYDQLDQAATSTK